jgi:hypothetical protein
MNGDREAASRAYEMALLLDPSLDIVLSDELAAALRSGHK